MIWWKERTHSRAHTHISSRISKSAGCRLDFSAFHCNDKHFISFHCFDSSGWPFFLHFFLAFSDFFLFINFCTFSLHLFYFIYHSVYIISTTFFYFIFFSICSLTFTVHCNWHRCCDFCCCFLSPFNQTEAIEVKKSEPKSIHCDSRWINVCRQHREWLVVNLCKSITS